MISIVVALAVSDHQGSPIWLFLLPPIALMLVFIAIDRNFGCFCDQSLILQVALVANNGYYGWSQSPQIWLPLQSVIAAMVMFEATDR